MVEVTFGSEDTGAESSTAMRVLVRSADLWSDLWSAVSPTCSRQARKVGKRRNLPYARQKWEK